MAAGSGAAPTIGLTEDEVFRPPAVGSNPSSATRSPFRALVAFLQRHPILCLLILTPGIPEYLSTSSSLTLLFVAPWLFFLFLALNVGLYGPGVLLIREALIRWRKGWASLILLGAAYGILEEGVALSTLFNPVHDGLGHYLGVNWVWTPGVLMVHIVFSIGLPILLLGLALPETRGRNLLGRRGIATVLGILIVDVLALMALTVFWIGFWMGPVLLAASLGTILVLVLVARGVPKDFLAPSPGAARLSPLALGLIGAVPVIVALLGPPVLGALGLPFWVVSAVIVATFGAVLYFVLWGVGTDRPEPQLLGLSVGLLVTLAIFGFLFSLPVPLVFFVDLALAIFLSRLWARYKPLPPATVPAFAAAGG